MSEPPMSPALAPTYSLRPHKQIGGTCYAHASAGCILKLIKKFIPEKFKDDGLDPERKCFFNHEKMGNEGNDFAKMINCPRDSAAWNNMAVYHYLLNFITREICPRKGAYNKGGDPRDEMKNCLQKLYNTETNFPELLEYVQKEFGHGTIQYQDFLQSIEPIIREFCRKIQEVSITVRQTNAFIIQREGDKKSVKLNPIICEILKRNLHAVLGIGSFLIKQFLNSEGELVGGSHAALIVGADCDKDTITIRNSWGERTPVSVNLRTKSLSQSAFELQGIFEDYSKATITYVEISDTLDKANPAKNIRASAPVIRVEEEFIYNNSEMPKDDELQKMEDLHSKLSVRSRELVINKLLKEKPIYGSESYEEEQKDNIKSSFINGTIEQTLEYIVEDDLRDVSRQLLTEMQKHKNGGLRKTLRKMKRLRKTKKTSKIRGVIN